jgi:hypothetical protein
VTQRPNDRGVQPLDFEHHLEIADRLLELVRARAPEAVRPQIRDSNDLLLVHAFLRAYRCLRSVRELAGRGEGDDAAVLTRALVALTLRYLWLACVDEVAERRRRFRMMLRASATERARLGRELLDLGHVDDNVAGGIEVFRETVERFSAQADRFEGEGVDVMLDDRAIALRLDRDLQPQQERFFELLYARIYRATSDVAHYGLPTALADYTRNPDDPGPLVLDRADEQEAAEALGLAIVTFLALLDFSEPIVQHGLTDAAADIAREIVDARRRGRPE